MKRAYCSSGGEDPWHKSAHYTTAPNTVEGFNLKKKSTVTFFMWFGMPVTHSLLLLVHLFDHLLCGMGVIVSPCGLPCWSPSLSADRCHSASLIPCGGASLCPTQQLFRGGIRTKTKYYSQVELVINSAKTLRRNLIIWSGKELWVSL